MACPYFSSQNTSGGDQEGRENELTYRSYLQLDRILGSQDMKCKPTVHDEHLFIVTHQAFELWFQQILYETDSITDMWRSEHWDDKNYLHIISRLNRVVTILKLCCKQIGVLETMTPREFVDFRNALGTASGFQSYQFRLIEIRFGVDENKRLKHNEKSVLELEAFREDEKVEFKNALSEPSLHQRVDDWLSKTIAAGTSDYWNEFEDSVRTMLRDKDNDADKTTDPAQRKQKQEASEKLRKTFEVLFDEADYNQSRTSGDRRFTYQAMQGALMISIYCDEPRFHVPFQLLQSLMDLDCQFMQFRYLHKDMVQRMIGSKMGSGGSSGYRYLQATCNDRYKVFNDLLNLSTYFLPRAKIPSLSLDMESLSLRDGRSGE